VDHSALPRALSELGEGCPDLGDYLREEGLRVGHRDADGVSECEAAGSNLQG
jgi:hypothetical protein